MQTSAISHRLYNVSYMKTQRQVQAKRNDTTAGTQQIDVIASTESLEVFSGYDVTKMTSADMLDLAKSFYEEGNTRDFLSLAVYSAQAALEDHPDPDIIHSWATPRNEDGTFNLLAEIQATPKYSTGSAGLDAQNKADREHLLHTLFTLPIQTIIIERSTIDVKA